MRVRENQRKSERKEIRKKTERQRQSKDNDTIRGNEARGGLEEKEIQYIWPLCGCKVIVRLLWVADYIREIGSGIPASGPICMP